MAVLQRKSKHDFCTPVLDWFQKKKKKKKKEDRKAVHQYHPLIFIVVSLVGLIFFKEGKLSDLLGKMTYLTFSEQLGCPCKG